MTQHIVVTHSSQKTCQLQFISTGTRRESASWMRRSICFVFFQIPSIISLLQGSRCGNINSSIRPSSQSVCRIDLNKFNQLCPHMIVFMYQPSTICVAHICLSKNAGGPRFKNRVLIEILIQPTNTHLPPQSYQLRFWLSGTGSEEASPTCNLAMVKANRKQ